MTSSKPQMNRRRAKYAIIGAMVGDALGTTYEFSSSIDATIGIAYHNNFKDGLIGKGPFNLCPGQFTDDTEMALAIMSVIVKKGYYDQRLVANAYHLWYDSNPIDIGLTTKNAVSQRSVNAMIDVADKYNKNSLSNGFLMRLFGLVSLYHDKSKDEMVNAISQDVVLTHSHPEAIHIAIIYGLMLNGAVHGMTSSQVYYLGKDIYDKSPLVKTIYATIEKGHNYFYYNDKKYKLSNLDTEVIGFVGYSFWLLLLSLKYFASYEQAILDIVGRGGDTDTNACIVGAVMGALYPNTIPKSWIQSVTNFRSESRFVHYPIANPKIWLDWLPK